MPKTPMTLPCESRERRAVERTIRTIRPPGVQARSRTRPRTGARTGTETRRADPTAPTAHPSIRTGGRDTAPTGSTRATPADPTRASRPRRSGHHHALLTGLLTTAILGAGCLPALCPQTHAATVEAATVEGVALRIAISKQGDPYEWGGTGPYRFDCSGLTYYAFRRAGVRLPRTAQAQYNRVQHIPRRLLHPGDLVFFHQGRYVYHVGIYAGRGRMWDAPHPGSHVRLERIWSTHVWFGRVR